MALSVIAVSISVSPLRIEDELVDMFITSAPSRLPASSNEDWVRVETSKNRLIWVRPRSEVRFFSTWRLSSTNSSPRSSRPEISSRESPSIPNRWRLLRTNEDFGAMFIKGRSIGASSARGKGSPRHRSTRLARAPSRLCVQNLCDRNIVRARNAVAVPGLPSQSPRRCARRNNPHSDQEAS